MIILYLITLTALVVYSWGFVDANMPIGTLRGLYSLVNYKRDISTLLYSCIIILLFLFYAWILRSVQRGSFTSKKLWKLIITTCVLLFFSFPGLSYDVFNYIATAKVTYLYRENPYIVMPIEIPNEPMLRFLHASNKTALYGPIWILLTAIPHFLGLGNLFLTVYTFKMFVVFWYLLLCFLIWKISNKNVWSLAFFALNPLVIIETLVSAHNDVAMMSLALGAFYVLSKDKKLLSCMLMLFSILIKYATIFLLPVYLFAYVQTLRKKKISYQSIWFWSTISLYLIFFLSPLREEIYAWYLIWPLTFVSLLPFSSFLTLMSLGFSIGLPFRLSPFLYTREWGGITPLVKKIVTFVPPVVTSFLYAIKKHH